MKKFSLRLERKGMGYKFGIDCIFAPLGILLYSVSIPKRSLKDYKKNI